MISISALNSVIFSKNSSKTDILIVVNCDIMTTVVDYKRQKGLVRFLTN